MSLRTSVDEPHTFFEVVVARQRDALKFLCGVSRRDLFWYCGCVRGSVGRENLVYTPNPSQAPETLATDDVGNCPPVTKRKKIGINQTTEPDYCSDKAESWG